MQQLLTSGSVLGSFLQVVPVTLLAGAVYGGLRLGYLKKQGSPILWGQETIRWLFVCYLTGLVNLVLVPDNLWTCLWSLLFYGSTGCEIRPFLGGGANFVPLLWKWLSGELTVGRWVLTMLAGNFVMFLPMGLFLPLVFPAKGAKVFWFAAAGIPAIIEVLQPVVGRSFDVDDLLMNAAGIAAGLLLAAGLKVLEKKRTPPA